MPRNPITGSLDVNDMTVYTGYADMPTANIAKWKIWYTDGTTYSNANGTIANAPDKLVAFGIIKKNNGKFFFIEGHDYYFFNAGVAGYSNDLSECSGKILQGGALTDTAYRDKILEALSDAHTK